MHAWKISEICDFWLKSRLFNPQCLRLLVWNRKPILLAMEIGLDFSAWGVKGFFFFFFFFFFEFLKIVILSIGYQPLRTKILRSSFCGELFLETSVRENFTFRSSLGSSAEVPLSKSHFHSSCGNRQKLIDSEDSKGKDKQLLL